MLYLIGMGLGNEKDLTLNAIDALRESDFVYLENYTSNLGFDIEDLKELIGKNIVLVDRTFVESEKEIMENSREKTVSLLIKGDVFSATTHSELFLSAKQKGINCKIIHNASVLTAVGDSGLSLYKFGKAVSIPFDNEGVESAYDSFLENKDMHTLFLLDLKPSENKYMNFKEGLNYLLRMSRKKGEDRFNLHTFCVVCAALGTDKEIIRYGKIFDLLDLNIEVYPQCFIIPGKLHFLEEEVLNSFRI